MTLITLEPDVSIEPGHQKIVIKNDVVDGVDGFYLAALLNSPVPPEEWIYGDDKAGSIEIPHTPEVDALIVTLINELARVRFSAPGLIQLELMEAGSG